MNKCTCNDPASKIGIIICSNCNEQHNRKLDRIEIMASCPEHRNKVAICCGGSPYLCKKCKADGYKIKFETDPDMDWMSPFKIVKRANDSSSSSEDDDESYDDSSSYS